jgi:hypothetical protein
MHVSLKCAAVWLLILWHKENALVVCNNGGLEKYSAATGIRDDPKPRSTDMMGKSSSQNNTDPVHKESDQVNSEGVSLSESTVATSEYTSIGSSKDGGTANPSPDNSDAGSTAATKLSGPLRLLVGERDNKTSRSRHRRGAVYEREAVLVYINVERISSSVEVTEEDAEKYSGGLEKLLKSDRLNESAGNGTECCGTVENGASASDENGAVGPSDSAANLTAQDSTVRSGIATPVARDEHNASRDKTPSIMPGGAKFSAEKLNERSPLHVLSCGFFLVILILMCNSCNSMHKVHA